MRKLFSVGAYHGKTTTGPEPQANATVAWSIAEPIAIPMITRSSGLLYCRKLRLEACISQCFVFLPVTLSPTLPARCNRKCFPCQPCTSIATRSAL